ncbi:helix-turn-helix transcriptional regulator [Curtobacterium sp. MCBD17_040]|uniref:helix-turn-helix domain-containing protein n=1 Tax=Curtobacterium sp. MCBD17_040 TaxID=2175674 RepID=UPI000DA7B597|nr:helix-turn-helix transcriptional regulator [Curtobacterium sp. MCBD17_040]WIB65529.1 helix-turn-helix transcriptional regulator [Curtobacterium sp. MCBD17_040]
MPQKEPPSVDSSIRRARQANNVSVRELARRLHVSPTAVSQMERSEARGAIQLGTLRKALLAAGPVSAGPAAPFERREDRVSFELHRAVAKKLIDDPDSVLSVVPDNLKKMRDRVHGPLAHEWLNEWERLTTSSVGALVDAMLATNEHAAELRQNSPFAGALSQDERIEAIRRASA